MFSERPLGDTLTSVRESYAPDALVLDCARDFETVPPEQAEELGILVDTLDPVSAPAEWVPADAPELLHQYAGGQFTIGMPGDGSVVRTRQTDPPVVLVKPRLEGSPDAFVDFLLAEAFVQFSLGEPDHFLGFFGEGYPAFHDATSQYLDPNGAYQVAAACYDAYLGLRTRDVFAGWSGSFPDLFDAWLDAGERLEPRLDGLATAMARGDTSFGDAAELACSGIKHAVELPSPFEALDADAYGDHGAAYAVQWAEQTFDTLS
jgi:hypothetical protein